MKCEFCGAIDPETKEVVGGTDLFPFEKIGSERNVVILSKCCEGILIENWEMPEAEEKSP